MLMSPFVSQRLTMFISSEDSSHIDRLAGYLADGTVVPAIGERYPLDQVPAAIQRMEAGELAGKTLIRIAGSAE
jgi:NADPH:quinone reductase-like Zn-dependent oxidoreductase